MSGLITSSGTITSGTSLSAAISLNPGYFPCAIYMPAAWTTAGITFQVSFDGVTYYNLYKEDGTEYTLTTPAASNAIALTPGYFAGAAYIKIRSGTSGSAVNQGADRSIIILQKE